jgi:hypothetical protein
MIKTINPTSVDELKQYGKIGIQWPNGTQWIERACGIWTNEIGDPSWGSSGILEFASNGIPLVAEVPDEPAVSFEVSGRVYARTSGGVWAYRQGNSQPFRATDPHLVEAAYQCGLAQGRKESEK